MARRELIEAAFVMAVLVCMYLLTIWTIKALTLMAHRLGVA